MPHPAHLPNLASAYGYGAMRHTVLLSGMTDDDKLTRLAEWDLALVANDHKPLLDRNGDMFVFKHDANHAGPACSACESHWCWVCDSPAEVKPCTGKLNHKLGAFSPDQTETREETPE